MRWPGVLVAMVVVGACGDGTERLRETVDSAGVAIVWNRGGDRPLAWSFERGLVLGGAEAGVESFFQVGRTSIAADSAGTLYVLDRGNFRVLVFDTAGIHRRTLGSQGGGPGELQFPTAILVTAEGRVGVADIGRRGVVWYAPDGTPGEQRAVEGWFGGRIAQLGPATVFEAQAGTDVPHDVLVAHGPGRTDTLLRRARPPMRPVDLGCVQIGGMPAVFAPTLVWGVGGGTLAAASTADYVVDLYTDGRLARSLRRALPARMATTDLAIQEQGDAFRVRFGNGGLCEVPAERAVAAMGVADVVPAVGAVAVAPDGTIWVERRMVRGEPAPIDVFDPGGAYLGTLPEGAPFPATFLPGGRLATVETDDLDVPRVVVYRVVESVRDTAGASAAGTR